MIEYCEYCGCVTEHTIDQTDEVNDKGQEYVYISCLECRSGYLELNADEKLYDRYQRKYSITLCFNDEEFAQVEELASMLKKPRATAVRDLILNKDFKLKKKYQK